MQSSTLASDAWGGDMVHIHHLNVDDPTPTHLAAIPLLFLTESQLGWAYIEDVVGMITGEVFAAPLVWRCCETNGLVNLYDPPFAGNFVFTVQNREPLTILSRPPEVEFLGYVPCDTATRSAEETIPPRPKHPPDQVIARDRGKCFVTGVRSWIVRGVHLAPRLPHLYRSLLGVRNINIDSPSYIVLMFPDMHAFYASYELSMYPTPGVSPSRAREEWRVHFFVPLYPEPDCAITTGYRALHARVIEVPTTQYTPNRHLARWHYTQTVRMRFGNRSRWAVERQREDTPSSFTESAVSSPRQRSESPTGDYPAWPSKRHRIMM